MANYENMINKMYDSQLASQKETLKTNHDIANSDLDVQKQKNQQAANSGITATSIAADKATLNNAELHNASGLSSGNRARVQQAQENKLHSDLTAIRAAQMEADAEVERQRGVLSQEYSAAIRQAQADNDLAKAQALYQEAKDQENKQLQIQLANAQAEATAQENLRKQQLEVAKLIAEETGDYTKYYRQLGLTDREIIDMGKTENAQSFIKNCIQRNRFARSNDFSTYNQYIAWSIENGDLSENEKRYLVDYYQIKRTDLLMANGTYLKGLEEITPEATYQSTRTVRNPREFSK